MHVCSVMVQVCACVSTIKLHTCTHLYYHTTHMHTLVPSHYTQANTCTIKLHTCTHLYYHTTHMHTLVPSHYTHAHTCTITLHTCTHLYHNTSHMHTLLPSHSLLHTCAIIRAYMYVHTSCHHSRHRTVKSS